MVVSGDFYLPNGMIFVKDSAPSLVPISYKNRVFLHNSTCISIRAKHEQEGKCRITFGAVGAVAPPLEPDFQQTIEVPTGTLIIMLVPRVTVLSLPTEATRVKVSVWLNDPNEADRVVIGVETD